MTVVVRPVPSRVARNGIRPFRVAVPANGIRQYTLKTWRPPVPEPLAPAPLLGPQTLLGLGALVLAQIWGWLGSRPNTKAPPTLPDAEVNSGTVPPPGNTTAGNFTIDRVGGTYEFSNRDTCDIWTAASTGNVRLHNAANVVEADYDPLIGSCGVRGYRWRVKYVNGTTGYLNAQTSSYGFRNFNVRFSVAWTSPGAVTWVPPTGEPLPLPDGWTAPRVETGAAPLPVPTPKPAFPVTVPAPPAVEPVPEVAPAPVEPGPSRPPAVTPIPLPARPSGPVRPAGPTPINNGSVVPAPTEAPTPTPGDVHFPWPGGPGVGPGGARPDIAAVAQEVGRIEQKLALMPRPGGDPSNPIDWGDLAATLLKIWEAISASSAGGTYTLGSPCVVNEATGERVVTEVQYSGGLTWLDVLNNKVDALAELQQAAKDLKQPICRHKAEGQPVTVTFTQQ